MITGEQVRKVNAIISKLKSVYNDIRGMEQEKGIPLWLGIWMREDMSSAIRDLNEFKNCRFDSPKEYTNLRKTLLESHLAAIAQLTSEQPQMDSTDAA
jgi:hypothetical protein